MLGASLFFLEAMLKAPPQKHDKAIPRTAPATWFPGRLPKEVIRGLKAVNVDLELKWSPRFGCWEVWHKGRDGAPYVFYRHKTAGGEFRQADTGLITAVMSRAMWTSYGKEMKARRESYARQGAQGKERDLDFMAWDAMRRTAA